MRIDDTSITWLAGGEVSTTGRMELPPIKGRFSDDEGWVCFVEITANDPPFFRPEK